ncbi:T-cell receptor beta chain V region PHDS203 [Heterocephalus glaber]|nr:T-cell receptor beta chain V region PHDS203 [Heterocephalus glaber]
MAARLLSCLAFYFLGADADISQIPLHCTTGIGKKIILECSQTMGHNKLYWYRQDPGRELQVIHYSYGVNTTEKGELSSESTVSRERTGHFPLTLESASPTHSSQYFRASSEYTALRGHPHPAQKDTLRFLFHNLLLLRDDQPQSCSEKEREREKNHWLSHDHVMFSMMDYSYYKTLVIYQVKIY